jgi:MFS family permease
LTAPSIHRTSRPVLAAFFFLVAMPMGMWFVPLGNVLKAYGYGHLLSWVLACSGIAAFVSPLIVGAIADQKLPPTRVLTATSLGTSGALWLVCAAIEGHWGDTWVLAAAMLVSLLFAPTWGISTAIVLSQLQVPGKQFGPVRAFATLGWVAGAVVVSYALGADDSVRSGRGAACFWLVVATFSWLMPAVSPADAQQRRSWVQVLGLDALTLLKNRDHRMVFITAALYSAPLAAFYPYCVQHLRALGVHAASAVMSLGQITEVLVMVLMAGLIAKFRLKWIFLSGIAFGVLRYVCFAQDTKAWVIVGIILHGLAYTLYFITTQIYLEDRIDPKWRVRAQALLTLLTAGVGNLSGYLGSGWWFAEVQHDGHADWPLFWWVLAGVTGAVFVLFATTYHGRKFGEFPPRESTGA